MEFNELKKILMTKLTNKRYQHSLGVADTAALLAKRFGCCIEKAKIAGLMHDCARAFSNEEDVYKRQLLRHEAEYQAH